VALESRQRVLPTEPQGPAHGHRHHEDEESREREQDQAGLPHAGPYSDASRDRRSCFASSGLALPPVSRMTWPMKKPRSAVRPAR
jgi:hypothetical protein